MREEGGKATEEVVKMGTVVDPTRCQGYAQCMFLAPAVFELRAEEGLLYVTTVPDDKRFPEPDRFGRTRPDNEHLDFGSGIHLRYGGPLARIEAHAALGAPIPYLGTARLVQDSPPNRQNAMLRGPRHLPVQL